MPQRKGVGVVFFDQLMAFSPGEILALTPCLLSL